LGGVNVQKANGMRVYVMVAGAGGGWCLKRARSMVQGDRKQMKGNYETNKGRMGERLRRERTENC